MKASAASVLVLMSSVVLGSMGCAGSGAVTGVASGAAGPIGAGMVSACPIHPPYNDDQLALIARMRDDGAGRKEVAARVGGTRSDVKCAEAALRSRRGGERPRPAKEHEILVSR